MTVLVSMLTLVPGGMGGSETYARELLQELAGCDIDVRSLVSPAGRGFSRGVPEQVVDAFMTGQAASLRTRALVRAVLRRRHLTRQLAGADVVHYPFTVPVPRAAAGQRTIVSLHDVQHHDLPHMFSRAERFYRARAYDRAARQADAVVTISDFCKRQIVTHLRIDPARVHVAHLGVRAEEFTPNLGPRESFLLYPAKPWPHKNHSTLFEGFRLVRQRHPALELVLTGALPGELPPAPNGVQVRGHVSRAELAGLYRRAGMLVFPSRYEGFGLPPIEAMASGCPVAAADAGSLPEVVSDAGVLFDPADPEDVARGIEQAMDMAEELQRRGMMRARRFTWSACAAVHEQVYRVLGG